MSTTTVPRARAAAVLRLFALSLAVLSFASDCGIFWTAGYGGGVSPPQYLARGPVFEALTFPSPAYLAVLAAPAVAFAAAMAYAILSWGRLARPGGRGRPPLGPVAVAVVSALGLVPISSDLDQSGSTSLYSVAMSSATAGWAVGGYLFHRGGESGVIWRFDGSGWREVARQTNTLRSVAALPDGEAWVVGEGGTVLHESGGRWDPVDAGTADDLLSVAMRSPDEGWAVGGHETIRLAASITRDDVPPAQPGGGTCVILHYLDGRWSPVACPVQHPLGRVTVLPDGEAWAIGNRILLHETDGRWTQAPAPAGGLGSLAMTSPDDGWAAGDAGALVHYHAGAWTSVPPVTTRSLQDIALGPTGDGWSVGDNVILRLRHGTWQPVPGAAADGSLFGVGLAPGAGGAGWAVGAGTGTAPEILRLQGGTWQAYPAR